ncbi:MAG: DUF5946 family protein, partial [Pseudomonadota bacterium]|nr:DUF5946 family protein [Pseudomonadota bacterium]
SYMVSSPACWAAFGDVLAREYSNPALLSINRLSVDAYAVQHPGVPSRQSIQSVGLHLIRLCLFLEHGLMPEKANEAMLIAGKIKHTFTWLEPPSAMGNITVKDVVLAQGAAEHADMVRSWARSAWVAWTPHHAVVKEWLVRSNVHKWTPPQAQN